MFLKVKSNLDKSDCRLWHWLIFYLIKKRFLSSMHLTKRWMYTTKGHQHCKLIRQIFQIVKLIESCLQMTLGIFQKKTDKTRQILVFTSIQLDIDNSFTTWERKTECFFIYSILKYHCSKNIISICQTWWQPRLC